MKIRRGGILERKKTKLVIWDLDNTIWNGILVEDKEVVLRDGITEIIKTLDERGILQSIASKNDMDVAFAKLEEFKLAEYFLYPQINWGPKSKSVETIVKSINIGFDTVCFIDDQVFERDEVNAKFPEVLSLDVCEIEHLLERDEMNSMFITSDSKYRRQLYQTDIIRKEKEEMFEGTEEEFLKTLDLKLKVKPAEDGDLKRAEELTVRTHQLNSTGYTYSYEELKDFITNPNYLLYVAELEDRYGKYGTIGIILLECEKEVWTIKLLITSCRVMSRGVGNCLLSMLVNFSRRNHVELHAEFVPTDRNRIMAITYSLNGFHVIEKGEDKQILCYQADKDAPYPSYIDLTFVE